MAVAILLVLLAVDTFVSGWLLAHRAHDVSVIKQLGDECQRLSFDLDEMGRDLDDLKEQS